MDGKITFMGEIAQQRTEEGYFNINYPNSFWGPFFVQKCEKREADNVYSQAWRSSHLFPHIFPPCVAQGRSCLVYRLCGMTLEDFVKKYQADLIHEDSSGAQILSDKLKQIFRELIWAKMSCEQSRISLNLSKKMVRIRDGDWPRVEAIGIGDREFRANSWEDLIDLINDTLNDLTFNKNEETEVKAIKSFCQTSLLPRVRVVKLHSRTFWTKKTKIGIMISLGETVEAAPKKFGDPENPPKLQNWRARVQSLPELKPIESDFFYGKTPPVESNALADSFVFFMRWMMFHHNKMKLKMSTLPPRIAYQVPFKDRMTLLIYCEQNIPDLMHELYRGAEHMLKVGKLKSF